MELFTVIAVVVALIFSLFTYFSSHYSINQRLAEGYVSSKEKDLKNQIAELRQALDQCIKQRIILKAKLDKKNE